MASSADETIRMRDAALEARDTFRAISDIMSNQLATSRASADQMTKLRDSLKGMSSIEDRLLEVQRQKQEYIEDQVKQGKFLNNDLLKRFNLTEDLLKKEKERKDAQEQIRDMQSEFKDSLLGSLGTLGDMVKAGSAFGAGMILVKKASEMVSTAFESTVGLAKELYTQTGATAGEAARVGVEVTKASLSMTGLLYGSEAVADAAKSTAEYFGSTRVISSDMLKNVTELNAMMGDGAGAAQMSQLLQSASGNAAGLTDEIKEIAQGVGVDASEVFKEMGKNANLLVGKSKEEIKILAKKTAELKKQGMSMDLMNSVSENMLDVESSLRAEMKARVFGMDVNTAAMREAALAFEMTGDATALSKALQEQIGTAEEFGEMGPMQQRIYADALGMTSEQITDMLIKEEALQKQVATYGKEGAERITKLTSLASSIGTGFAASMPLLAQTTGFMKNIGIDAAKALGPVKKLAMAGLSKLGMGGGGAAGGSSKSPEMPKGDSKGMKGMTDAISKIDGKKLIAGGAALVLVAASVFVFAKAVQEFMNVSWEAVGMAVVSMLALVGAMALLGTIMAGPGGGLMLIGAAAMLVIAAALFVLGKAIQEIAKGFGMFGELTGQLTALVLIAPGLIALAGIFGLLGVGLLAMSVGLAAVTLFLPTLLVLGMMLPLITSALGMGGDGGDKSNVDSTEGSSSDALLQEIKGLRFDIQNQPVQIVIDDKVISTMNKKNSRMQGYRDQMR